MSGQSTIQRFGLSYLLDRLDYLQRKERARPHFRTGYLRFHRKNYQDALAPFTKAIEIVPDYGLAYLYRGRTYKKLKQYEQALIDFVQATIINPRHLDAYLEQIGIYMLQKDYQSAVVVSSKYLALKPHHFTVLTQRSAAYFFLQESAKAYADIDLALKFHPKNAKAYELVGQIYTVGKDFPKA